MHLRLTLLILLALCCSIIAPAAAQPTTARSAEEEEDILYRPPTAATANARMGGGSRGNQKLPSIAAIVPEHVGLAASPQPKLYWFCSEATDLPREFSLVDSQTLDTVKRVKMQGPVKAGWQKIDLAEVGIELKQNVVYEWRVALVAGTNKRSDDAVAGGMIQHSVAVRPAPNTPPLKRAAELAEGGVWYDAVATIMAELEADPSNAPAKKMLATLLSQVKLDEAAEFAR